MIILSRTIDNFGAYKTASMPSVSVNVHDSEHGTPSATVSVNFGNASIILHASESDLRALSLALDDAAIKIAGLSRQVAA